MTGLRMAMLGAAGLAAMLAFQPASAKTPADTFVMAKDIDDIVSLDPGETFELSGIEVTGNVYDRVMRYKAEDIKKLQGEVAESWTISPDGKTFTFKIRPG